jgi:hypothetical protein
MTTPHQARLPSRLRSEVLDRLVDPETVGVLLGGSFARGEETSQSDVDLLIFRRTLDARPGENRYLRASTEDRLVTWSPTTTARERERMGRPRLAIWVVPGIRQAIPLLDRDGSIAALKEAASSFRWKTLAGPARLEASESLAALCEEVGKVVTGLERRDPYRVANAVQSLATGLTQAVAMAYGVLIETENRWLLQVEDSIGAETRWSRSHRQMLGLEGDGASTIWARGEAGLRCYLETAALFEGFLQPADRAAVELARREIGPR